MSNSLDIAALVAVLWLILIVAFRRRSWGIVLWLPLFSGLTFWMLFVVAPLFKPVHGVDSGWVAMGNMFSLMFNAPLIVLWIILIFCYPPKRTANWKTVASGVVVTPLLYLFSYWIFTNQIILRIVDQDGKGIANCSIKYTLVSHNVFFSRESRFHGSTDSNGFFQFRTFPSQAMDIDSISANGYELEPNTRRSYGLPDRSQTNPIAFKMWSTKIHEPLITGKKRFHVVPDGRLYVIDLNQGTIAESGSGDLEVWINYTNQVIRGQLYDWSCEITPTTGGLLEETDPYSSMFLAPPDGYVPTFQLQQQIKGGQYGSIRDKRFYVMLENGREYGRITIDLIAPYNDQIPGMIDIQYAVNPSGLRILH